MACTCTPSPLPGVLKFLLESQFRMRVSDFIEEELKGVLE